MTPKTNKLRDAITLAIAMGAAATVGHAFAQDPAPAATASATAETQTDTSTTDLDRIEVTGSRIRSVDAETSQPILTLSREDIEKQGVTSVAEVLQRVSASGGTAINRSFNNGGNGSSEIALRALGSSRTLVLVDGRRWVQSLGGSVDLNTIPAAIIERIEVLKDGASSIYGSDAIAGVINLITRDNFEGAEFRTHIGQFNQGDGDRKTIDATLGSSSERGNVVLSLSRVEEGAVMAGDRRLSRDPVFGLGARQYSGFSSHGKIWNAGPAGPDDFSEFIVLTPDAAATGQRYARDQFVPWSTDYAYNYAKDNYLLTPQTRTSAYLKGRWDLTDNIAFRAQGLYNERRSQQQLAGFPLSGGPALGNDANTLMSPDSYYNPYNTEYGGDGRAVTWSHRLTEQPRVYQQNVKTFHTYVGFEGSFDVGDRFFNWDVGYSFNKSDQTDRQFGDANMLRVAEAVGPSFMDVDGIVKCGAPGAIIDGCVPFNPLSPAGGVTQEMLDYILFTAQDVFQNRGESFTANLTGEMFDLPGGKAGFAVGVESRKESGFDSPDALVAAGQTSGNARQPTSGGYDLNELYAEFLLPVLSDTPGADLLEFSLATRYSEYSSFGDTLNSKFGFKWKPFGDLLVRGNWAEGFRAPAVSDLYQGLADSYTQFGDICSSDYEGRNATIAASCAAHGVPNNFVQQTNQGFGYFGQTIHPFSIGGNPNLGPETSTSKTLGLVYSPSFADGLNISLDWWSIEIEEALSTPSAGYILDQCYNGGDQAFCSLFTRDDSSHQINQMFLVPRNLSVYEVEGYDLNIGYRMPETSIGVFRIGLDASYMAKWDVRTTADAEIESNVGRYFDRDPTWRLRGNAVLDWTRGDLGASWTARYVSGLAEDCPFPGEGLCTDEDRWEENDQGVPVPAARNHMGATTYHDVQVRYNVPWNGMVKLGVNNVFKKVAPVSYVTFANSFDPQYDIPDSRYLYLEYSQNF